MKVLLVIPGVIPVTLYGGTERVVWGLGKALVALGHQVTYLAKQGSRCSFAQVIPIREDMSFMEQVPDDVDVVHFHTSLPDVEKLNKPYVITLHGGARNTTPKDKNTIFLSADHAQRYNSTVFVHNGLDWDSYTKPVLNTPRSYFHFLGKAAWRVKNVQGAIDVVRQVKGERLKVLGGKRLNIKMGFRFTLSHRVSFEGMVGGAHKDRLINASKGLVFPVKWAEPFGLAIIESLYYGCPVFGTPYGALPELVTTDVGCLSNKKNDLAAAVSEAANYSRQHCHEYARDVFSAKQMALGYLEKAQV